MPIPLASRIAALVPTLTGWCSEAKANDLALAVLKTKSSVSVEIGVWGGKSFLPLVLAHQEQDFGVAIGIDPWSAAESVVGYDKVNADWWGSQNHELVYQNFLVAAKKLGADKYMQVIRARSDDVTPPKQISLLHLDGLHTDQAVRDVERFAVNVVPSGFVFADDVKWQGGGVERAVEKLLTMGFVQLFERDTGAMFERQIAKASSAKRRGRPPGAKNKKGKKKGTK